MWALPETAALPHPAGLSHKGLASMGLSAFPLPPRSTPVTYPVTPLRHPNPEHLTKGALPHLVAEYHFKLHCNGIKPVPNIIQIRPAVLELNRADRQTGLTRPICVHFMHLATKQRKISIDCIKFCGPTAVNNSVKFKQFLPI
jgi:hypothetical protein